MNEPRATGENGEKNVRRLVYVRLTVSTVVVGAAIMVLQIENMALSIVALYGLLGVIYLSTGSAYLAFRAGTPMDVLVRALLGVDIAVLTMIAHYSGGSGSYFTILFILPIIVGGEYFKVSGGLAVSLIASSAYILYTVLEFGGYVHPPGGGWMAHSAAGGMMRPLLRGYLHIAVFLFTGLISGYVSRRLENKHEEIADKELELRRIRLDTDSILQNMSSGLIVTDLEGSVLTFNPSAVSILGMRADLGLKGKKLEEVLQHMPHLVEELRAAMEIGLQRQRHEIEVPGPGGDAVPLGMSISLLRDEMGETRGVIAIFQDLTEVKRMRERIRMADRLAAVGELSAAIAHEVRAPLASICGSIEMLRSDLEGLSGDNADLMDLILRESDRLDRIISDFLEFARIRRPKFERTDLSEIAEDTVMLLRNSTALSRESVIEIESDDSRAGIYGDEEQIRQVFLNLGINACEAMKGRGELSVRIRRADHVLSEGRPAEECMEVEFFNMGPAIPEDVLPHVFEPFYTTKDGGTGLGLAIAARIVESHSGVIRVGSTAAEGTAFTVILPVHAADADEAGDLEEETDELEGIGFKTGEDRESELETAGEQ